MAVRVFEFLKWLVKKACVFQKISCYAIAKHGHALATAVVVCIAICSLRAHHISAFALRRLSTVDLQFFTPRQTHTNQTSLQNKGTFYSKYSKHPLHISPVSTRYRVPLVSSKSELYHTLVIVMYYLSIVSQVCSTPPFVYCFVQWTMAWWCHLMSLRHA